MTGPAAAMSACPPSRPGSRLTAGPTSAELHHGLPSFRRCLPARPGRGATSVPPRLRFAISPRRCPPEPTPVERRPDRGPADRRAGRQLRRRFDSLNGSRRGAAPQPMTLDFLLGRLAGGDPSSGAMVRYSTGRRWRIHDQLGGGFHLLRHGPIWLAPFSRADALYHSARTYPRVGDARRDSKPHPPLRRGRDPSSSTPSASFAAMTGTFAASLLNADTLRGRGA